MRTRASAIQRCTTPCSMIGRPKVDRAAVRSHMSSSARSAIPIARIEVSAIKVAAPDVATWVIDRAIQAHGGMGVSQDTLLPELYAVARILQIADGPDEVHYMAIARRETRRYRREPVQV